MIYLIVIIAVLAVVWLEDREREMREWEDGGEL